MRPIRNVLRPAQLVSTVSKSSSQRTRLRKLLCESLEQRALMAVLSVSNLDDNGPGSLRAIVAQANASPEDDTIEFNLPAGPQTITLTSGEIAITRDVSIVGPGSNLLTISGNNNSRIFNVQEELNSFDLFVGISGMNLTNGRAVDGGALRNQYATVTLVDVYVTASSASGNGGGIFTQGEPGGGGVIETAATLYMYDSRIVLNTAGGSGGGIYNDKDHVELYNTAVQNNQATLDGGGVFTEGNPSTPNNEIGTLYFRDRSLMSSNRAGRNGGGVYAVNDFVSIENAIVSNNSAVSGGGVYALNRSVNLFDATLSSNTATADGGGIYAQDSFVSLSNSTVSDNTAATDGGGIFLKSTGQDQFISVSADNSTIANNRAVNGTGGGIRVDSASLNLFRTSVESNQATSGGGIYISNTLNQFSYPSIEYSTVSGNVATSGPGGGIALIGSPPSLSEAPANGFAFQSTNSTISGNRTTTQGGGVYVGNFLNPEDRASFDASTIANNQAAAGGGIYVAGGTEVSMNSNLIANNSAASAVDAFGVFEVDRFENVSRYNLIGNADGSQWIPEINQFGSTATPINPLIGPLQNNGGPTKTHALLPGSPAIGASFSGFFEDQRGLRRTESGEGATDIGAYEIVLDFGDAPNSFPTTLANNGARHVIGSLYLGNAVDSEDNGRPSAATFANADDVEWSDDEDGVIFNFSSTAGFTGSAQVTSSGAGLINAWIDVNSNDSWEPTEQVLTNAVVVAGVNLLTFTLPAPPANASTSFNAVARFRLSTQAGLQPTGPAADGEVEDYAMNISRVILPTGSEGDGFTFTFAERVPPRVRRAYDPELAYGYNYATNPAVGSVPAGDNFTEVELLAGFGDDVFTIHLFNTTTNTYESLPLATVTAPAIVNFETGRIEDANGIRVNAFTGIAGGVSKFRVLGIELAEGLSPNDTQAFPTFLAFANASGSQSVVNFTMTPLATPVAVSDAYAVLEDSSLLVTHGGLLGNDSDRNGDTLTAFVLNNPANGTLVLAANGTFTYQPNANFNGVDVFTYRAFDGLQYSDPVSVTISVGSVNDAPAGTDATFTILEDSVKTFAPADFGLTDVNDSPANALLSVTVVDLPTVGVLSLNGTAVEAGQVIPAGAISNLTFAPVADANGVAYASFTFRVQDNGGVSDAGVDLDGSPNTIAISVTPVNDAPNVLIGGNQLVPEDVGVTVVTGFATFSAGPVNESSQVLTILVTNNNNELFSVQPTIGADGTLTYTPAADANGTATISVVVKDDGGTANGGIDTSLAKTFEIQVFFVNDAPSFTPGPNPSSLEDSGAQTLVGWASAISPGPANESSQGVTFTVTNNNNALFAVQPSIAANGTLTYTPAANANGSATVVVVLTDNVFPPASVQQSFTISVTPVNDAPAFTKGVNLTVASGAGAQTVNGWATGILAGPTDEAGQAVSFTVTNNNNALFAVQPSVATNGTLTFTPAATGSGTATVSVLLKDNGGTANGGVDSSAVQTFTITVNAATGTNRPTASIAGPGSAVRGQSVAFTLLATDPDAGDNAAGFGFTINWGDGSSVQTLPPGTPSGTVVNHTFAASGRFTVSVTARDRTGQVSSVATRIVAVGAILQQGNVLVIGGTTNKDAIDVFNLVGLRAVINGAWFGPYTGITSIQVYGQAGDDCLDIDSNVVVPALVDGGLGDDKIDGGSGNDTLLGGAGRDCIDGAKGNDMVDGGADNDVLNGGDGNDIVLGGAGNDTLYGGKGRDLLIGGLGADWLYGGSDDDILIGGTTSYDTNRTALDAIMLEWSRTSAAYATRLANLRDGGGLNGTNRLNATTVQNDSQVDQLFGESGADWFFGFNNATTGDRVRDRSSTETLTTLL